MSIKLRKSGHVEIKVETGNGPWRRVVEPNDMADLDQYAPDITAKQRREIIKAWATIPSTPPEPVDPVPTVRQEILSRLQTDPALRAQAIETRDRLGITTEKLLDMYEINAEKPI